MLLLSGSAADDKDRNFSLGSLNVAGVYTVASAVRNANYTCQVIDAVQAFTEPELHRAVTLAVGKDTLVLGISTTWMQGYKKFSAASSIFATAVQLAKSINPNIKIVLGGPNADTLVSYKVDAVILGYGEDAFIEYLNSGTESVDGTSKMDIAKFTRSQLTYSKYDYFISKVRPFEVSRGCVFKCKFCTFDLIGRKKNDYTKHAAIVKEEILKSYYEFGITKFWYMDDTHNDSIEKLQMMADIVQSLPFRLEYFAHIRLDLLRSRPEQYQLLKDGGITDAYFGLESFFGPSARAIGKGTSPDYIIEELHKFADCMPNVGTTGSFICGLPFETKETIQDWSEKLLNIDFPIDLVRMNPLYIPQGDKVHGSSEFSRQSDKYYTWTDNLNWTNGDIDREWAVGFSDTFLERRYPLQRLTCSPKFELATVGLEFPHRTLIKDLPRDNIRVVLSQAVQRYKDALLNGE